MAILSLGDTLEEKKQTYDILTEKSLKWGKVFSILGAIMALFFCAILSTSDSPFLAKLFAVVFFFVLLPFVYYWYGQVAYYGFLVTKIFMHERNIGASEIAGAVGTSVLVSYVIGGKGAVRKLGYLWLITLFVGISVGIITGLRYYRKFNKEAKELGFAQNLMPKMLQKMLQKHRK